MTDDAGCADSRATEWLPTRGPTQRALVPRRGGIGDRLPGNATRRTARRGVGPVALPRAWIPIDTGATLVDDLATRRTLGVRPHEQLVHWVIVDPHLARRHWPDYWVRIWGIDLATVTDPVTVGPIFTLPSQPGSPTDGRRLLRLEAEVRWRDSPVYALSKYRRGWPRVKITIERIEDRRNEVDVQMAEQGRRLAEGLAPRGRPRSSREQELDRLARLGLAWVQVPGTGRSPADLTWPILALADQRRPEKLKATASARSIGIADVQRRVAERAATGGP